uniref:Putative group i salivary lipocalin n=1 Tax=Rhipicephalus microplus TaxID=6941 RepID=A0A6G5A6W1_RHIMP
MIYCCYRDKYNMKIYEQRYERGEILLKNSRSKQHVKFDVLDMLNQCILAVLTIVAFTVSVKCAGSSYFPDFPKMVPDITKFYTENATIYTLRTTKRTLTCKVDEVANQTDSSVFFKRSYCKGEKWVNKTLEGTFISVSVFARGTFDAMIVHPPEPDFTVVPLAIEPSFQKKFINIENEDQGNVFAVTSTHFTLKNNYKVSQEDPSQGSHFCLRLLAK